MDERMREMAAELRSKPSSEAVDWLLSRYPLENAEWGNALTLIDHISLRADDARRLASYYLSRAPYASDRPYRIFARALGLRRLLDVLGQSLPIAETDRDLLLYHLRPLFEASTSNRERNAISAFMDRLDLPG